MRCLGVVWLSLAAMFALAVIGATPTLGAPHLPEWGRCVLKVKGTKPKGRFLNDACTEHSAKPVGSFEWKRPLAGTAVAISGGGAVFEEVGGRKIVCDGGTSGSADLSAHSPQSLLDVNLVFKGCVEPLSGTSCQNQHSPPTGEISTHQLRGTLGYISGQGTTKPEVGLVLAAVRTASRPRRSPFMSLAACDIESRAGKMLVQIGEPGSAVISRIGPVDHAISAWTQIFSESAPGVQSLTKFELGGAVGFETSFTLHSGRRQRSAISLELTATTTEPVEIRAVLE